MSSFNELLNTLTLDDLKPRLPFLSRNLKPTRKADIIQYIYDDCMQHHEDYWDKLSNLEKKSISEVLHQNTPNGELIFDEERFEAKYGEIPKHFRRDNIIWPKPPLESYLALFFYNQHMPSIYKKWMKSYVEKPATITIPTITEDQIPHYIQGDESDKYKTPIKRLHMEEVAEKDLDSVLRFVEAGQCAVSEKTHRASAATIRKLDKLLLGGDYFLPEDHEDIEKWQGSEIFHIRSFAWPLLLQASGLAKRTGKKLQLTNNGKKALNAPLQKTVKTLYQRWRNKSLLDEFSRVDEIKGQAGKGRVMTAVAPRKKAIEEILKKCPVDKWIGIDGLFQYIKSTGVTFDVTHDDWRLYISDREYGALGYSGFATFEILQGRYILTYFFEYLATIGMLDIAYSVPYSVRNDFQHIWGADDLYHLSRYDGLLYFRINPLGAYCLGFNDDYQPKTIDKPALLEIHPDLSLHLLRQASPAETMLLERYTKKLSDDTWQLTDGKILAAMESNFSAKDLKTFLQENSKQSDLSGLIDGFFTAATERENSLEDMGAARLLHCYSEGFAKMLASSTETKKYCIHVSGSVIATPEKTKKQFMKGLHTLGYVYPQEKN